LESVGIQEQVCACCEADRAENCDEYALDQDEVHDEGDFKGPESMFAEMNFLHGVVRAVMDSGAKSFWVDKAWFLEIGGTMKMCSGCGATGADGRSLPVAGNGVLPQFELWGCVFDGVKLRVIDRLPSKLLVGVEFWLECGLQLDLSNLCARIRVDGVEYTGPVSPTQLKVDVNEEILEVEETELVTRDILSMDLTEFSEYENDRIELRDLLLEFQDIFCGIGLVRGFDHRIVLKPVQYLRVALFAGDPQPKRTLRGQKYPSTCATA
jgi:hypothetical protein